MNIAAIFAGGVGSRMHSREKPKQFLTMHEKPIILHTLGKFNNHPEIDAITLALRSGFLIWKGCKKVWNQKGAQNCTRKEIRPAINL